MKIAERTSFKTFEDLECWKQCRTLRLFITANIAEGYGRFHYLDNAKFCSNARGSCWEVLDHLITGNDEEFISTELLNRGRTLVGQAVKLLNGYMNYLKRASGDNRNLTTDNQ